jgi:hypothetical protein
MRAGVNARSSHCGPEHYGMRAVARARVVVPLPRKRHTSSWSRHASKGATGGNPTSLCHAMSRAACNPVPRCLSVGLMVGAWVAWRHVSAGKSHARGGGGHIRQGYTGWGSERACSRQKQRNRIEAFYDINLFHIPKCFAHRLGFLFRQISTRGFPGRLTFCADLFGERSDFRETSEPPKYEGTRSRDRRRAPLSLYGTRQ